MVTQTFWYTGCRYLDRGNKTANINVWYGILEFNVSCSLSTSYNGEITHRRWQKIMNGDITLEAR